MSIIYHQIKFRKGIMNRSSIKKLFLKISQYSQKNSCVRAPLLIKMEAFRPETLLKSGSNTSVFLWIQYCKILRAPVLKNICERLFERFATWANNITSNRKRRKIVYQLDEKNLPLHDALDHFVFFYLSTACVRQRLPYVIRDNRSEGL